MSLFEFITHNWRDLLTLAGEHLWLVMKAMVCAVVIALPVGVLLTRRKGLQRPVLGVASVLQTIPSLALFGFLIPLPFGGIGPRSAVIALVLYALLPLLRNTVAGIEGVVSRLDVNPGTVSRPGTSVWGEILDLRELDVRCDVTAGQANQVAVGQAAEVYHESQPDRRYAGRVVFVGIAADPATGKVPVRVRVANPEGRLRCYIDVKVRFGKLPPTRASK